MILNVIKMEKAVFARTNRYHRQRGAHKTERSGKPSTQRLPAQLSRLQERKDITPASCEAEYLKQAPSAPDAA